jgi:hypothetical protein
MGRGSNLNNKARKDKKSLQRANRDPKRRATRATSEKVIVVERQESLRDLPAIRTSDWAARLWLLMRQKQMSHRQSLEWTT